MPRPPRRPDPPSPGSRIRLLNDTPVRPLSARNPRVQRLARLARRREERTRERALVVEGPTAISGALDAAVVVQEIYVEDGAADRPPVAAVLARLATVDGAPHPWEVPAGVLERIAGAAQGVVAIVEEPVPTWPTPDRCRFVLVLVDVADPGNVGTLVRAAGLIRTDHFGLLRSTSFTRRPFS